MPAKTTKPKPATRKSAMEEERRVRILVSIGPPGKGRATVYRVVQGGGRE